MDALILSEQQAEELRRANQGSMLRLEPRRLSDGRLVLNADVLDDPLFTDRSRSWATVLLAPVEEVNEEPPAEGMELSPEIDVEFGVEVPESIEISAGIQRVTLNDSELI